MWWKEGLELKNDSSSLSLPFLAKINDIVMATYRVMKSKLPSTLQSMSLYLANRDTEFILFKPVRVGVC